jgi:hypothetical protein
MGEDRKGRILRNRKKRMELILGKNSEEEEDSTVSKMHADDNFIVSDFPKATFPWLGMFIFGDKPFYYLIIPLAILFLTRILGMFQTGYFPVILFLFYQYVCGNSIITFFLNSLVYFGLIYLSSFIYKFVKNLRPFGSF